MSSVITLTVKNQLCCGCGVCVSLCPSQVLGIKFNDHGEYNPYFRDNSCTNCGKCLKTCPFYDRNPNEDLIGTSLFEGIHHNTSTGYYLSSYVGAVKDETERWKSASGGLASSFLSELLEKKIVDAVLCVRKSTSPNTLYEYFVATSADDIKTSRGSAYYPTEMSEVITYTKEHPGKFAVIGVPCFIKSLRLAQSHYPWLKERIIWCIGLTCGRMKTAKFTSQVAEFGGLNEPLESVSYRVKSPDRSANLFSFDFVGTKGGFSSVIRNRINSFWNDTENNVPSCNFCDDIFAECADVTFMDAWLPEYSQDPRGTSLCIVRSRHAHEILVHLARVSLTEIDIDKVIKSQSAVIRKKRDDLAYRLYLRRKEKRFAVPVKRVSPVKFCGIFYKSKCLFRSGWRFGMHCAGKILKCVKLR